MKGVGTMRGSVSFTVGGSLGGQRVSLLYGGDTQTDGSKGGPQACSEEEDSRAQTEMLILDQEPKPGVDARWRVGVSMDGVGSVS